MTVALENINGPALVIGATGYIGQFVANACLDSGHTTYVLVSPGGKCLLRAATIEALRKKGAIIIEVINLKILILSLFLRVRVFSM
jgi:leucoanthocyanidin reductase